MAEAVLRFLMETDRGVIGAGRQERFGELTTYRNGSQNQTPDMRLGFL